MPPKSIPINQILATRRQQLNEDNSDASSDEDSLGPVQGNDQIETDNELFKVLSSEATRIERDRTPVPDTPISRKRSTLKPIPQAPPPPPPLPTHGVFKNTPKLAKAKVEQYSNHFDLTRPDNVKIDNLDESEPTVNQSRYKSALPETDKVEPSQPPPPVPTRRPPIPPGIHYQKELKVYNIKSPLTPPESHKSSTPLEEYKAAEEQSNSAVSLKTANEEMYLKMQNLLKRAESLSDSTRNSRNSEQLAPESSKSTSIPSVTRRIELELHHIGYSDDYIHLLSELGIPTLFADPRLNVLNQFCREYLRLRKLTKPTKIVFFSSQSHFCRVYHSLRTLSKETKPPFIVNDSSPASPALLLHLFRATLLSKDKKITEVAVSLPSFKKKRTLSEARFTAIVTGVFHLYETIKHDNGIIDHKSLDL